MKIVLINAAAPDYSRKKRYSPSAFAEASVAFAATELEEGTISEAKLDGYHIWHASSLHARQTADMLIGTNTAGRSRGIPSAGRRTSLNAPPSYQAKVLQYLCNSTASPIRQSCFSHSDPPNHLPKQSRMQSPHSSLPCLSLRSSLTQQMNRPDPDPLPLYLQIRRRYYRRPQLYVPV